MDWTELPYFLAVARGGSLRAAAELMGGSHATVDRHIRALETTYGVALFQRTANGLKLTPAGSALLPEAQRAEATILSARRAVTGLDRQAAGRVSLTMPAWIATLVVGPILPEFSAAYPQIDLDITVTNRFQKLSNAEADVSVRVAFEVEDDVVCRRLFHWDLAMVASRDYLDRHWEQRGPQGEGLHWIGWRGPTAAEDWGMANPFPKAKTVHSVGDELMYFHMIQRGHGMASFPYATTHLFPGVVRVPGTPVRADRSIWLMLHSDLRRAARVRALVDFLADRLGSLRSTFQAPEGVPRVAPWRKA